jgi:hypothetical protein
MNIKVVKETKIFSLKVSFKKNNIEKNKIPEEKIT